MSRLYPCVYCTEDGYCKKYSDDEVTSWCVQSLCKDEKPSNADRVRGMTDEELAEFMNCGACPPGNDVYELCHDEDGGSVPEVPDMCNLCWLDWLKQEVET